MKLLLFIIVLTTTAFAKDKQYYDCEIIQKLDNGIVATIPQVSNNYEKRVVGLRNGRIASLTLAKSYPRSNHDFSFVSNLEVTIGSSVFTKHTIEEDGLQFVNILILGTDKTPVETIYVSGEKDEIPLRFVGESKSYRVKCSMR